VGSFYLAVEPWGAGFDADVVDAEVEQVEVERGAEFRPVECLHPLHLQGQFGGSSQIRV
jgi:hypothetical protein